MKMAFYTKISNSENYLKISFIFYYHNISFVSGNNEFDKIYLDFYLIILDFEKKN